MSKFLVKLSKSIMSSPLLSKSATANHNRREEQGIQSKGESIKKPSRLRRVKNVFAAMQGRRHVSRQTPAPPVTLFIHPNKALVPHRAASPAPMQVEQQRPWDSGFVQPGDDDFLKPGDILAPLLDEPAHPVATPSSHTASLAHCSSTQILAIADKEYPYNYLFKGDDFESRASSPVYSKSLLGSEGAWFTLEQVNDALIDAFLSS